MQVLNAVFYGLHLERAADLPRAGQRGDASTTSSAWRANYLQPDRLSVVLVGDASAFVKQLPASASTSSSVIPLAELDLSARRSAAQAAAPVGAVKPIAYRVAAGGSRQERPDGRARRCSTRRSPRRAASTKLQAIKTLRAEGTMTRRRSAGDRCTISTVTLIEYPDRFRVEADTPRRQSRRRSTPTAATGSRTRAASASCRRTARERDPGERPARHRPRAAARPRAGTAGRARGRRPDDASLGGDRGPGDGHEPADAARSTATTA